MDADIAHRFGYHKPQTPADGEAVNVVRTLLAQCADRVVKLIPKGREASLFLTKMEEAMMHANAGIARSWGEPMPFAEVG